MTDPRQSLLFGVQLLAVATAFTGDLFGLATLTAIGVLTFFATLALTFVTTTTSLVAGVDSWSRSHTPLVTGQSEH